MKRRVLYQLSLFVLGHFTVSIANAWAQGQPETGRTSDDLIYIDTSFENASPVYYEKNPEATTIYLMYDHERNSLNRAAGHMHVRLETRPGTTHQLEIRNLDNIYNGRPGSVAGEMHTLVVSQDGQTWNHVATEVFDNHVRLKVESPGTELYIARVEPYRLSDLARMIERISGNPLVAIEKIGQTVAGRDLEIIRIGDPNAARHVFLRGRAHAWEAGGNWILEGVVAGALADDEVARRFRSKCCLWILPMANKDAVARGWTRFNLHGRDLNRDWESPADPVTSPENFALERWLETRLNSGKRIDFAMEIHNDGNGKLHLNSPPEADRDRYKQRITLFEQLLRKHTWFSVGTTQVMHGSGTLANGWQTRYGIDGAVHEFNCQWIEKLKEPPLAKHWKEYGRGLLTVFDEYFQ